MSDKTWWEGFADHLLSTMSWPGDESDITNNWLLMTRNVRDLGLGLRIQTPRRAFRCTDGFTLSIQASSGTHCTPKTDDGPWTHVEVMLVDGKLHYRREWDAYDGNQYDDLEWANTNEPYSWVPVELVNRELEWHNKNCK